MNEYLCDLPNPLKAHIKIDGAYEHAEITKLYFKEPTARHCYISLKQIRGFITKCAMQMSNDKKQEVKQQETEAKFDAKALLTIISLDADVCEKFYNTIQQMLCNDLVFLDAEKKQQLKLSHFDTLDVESIDKLIETYLDFFSTYFVPKI